MLFLGVTALLIGADGEVPAKAAWEVRCRVDDLDDVRSCSLRNGNLEPQFALLIVGPKGSAVVMPGVHDFPGRKATVRVDQNKAIVFAPGDQRDSGKQVVLVEQLRQGKIVRFEYHQWPEGAQRGSLDLAGFREAYEELLRERDQTGSTDWRAGGPQAPEELPKAPEETVKASVQEASVFEVGSPTVSSGDVDREALARYVAARKPAIGACYDKEHRRKPGLAGTVRVRLLVSTSGRATKISVEENTLGDDAVVACIKSIIRTWVFPFKPDSDVPVSLPFAWAIEGGGNGALDAGNIGKGTVGGTVTHATARAISAQGSIDKEAVAKVVNSHLQEVRACYERALLKDPGLAGQVVLEWGISTTGTVTSAETRSSTMKNASVESCIMTSLKTWRFPPSQGSNAIVSYPFMLNSVGY